MIYHRPAKGGRFYFGKMTQKDETLLRRRGQLVLVIQVGLRPGRDQNSPKIQMKIVIQSFEMLFTKLPFAAFHHGQFEL